MNWKELEPKAMGLRQKLLSLMSSIEEESAEDKRLLKVSDTFKVAKELIERPEYDIVVCGEVKKGKSSLLNAIIGEDLLPVNNEIATSQVFRITNSRAEAYELVFTDGSRQPITRDQLSHYGSQVDANLRGEPVFKGRSLDFIQINYPIEFLPEGVNLVDTPGLGAIYKSHEAITQNYVRNAAAVIFVFDPERPLVQQEQAFIEKVLAVTPYLLFVMTKVDLYKEAVWSNQIRRSEELLAKLFEAKHYPAPQIFPMSSAALRRAATEVDEDEREMEMEDSYFPAVKEELLYMMYKTVGMLRTGFALSEVEKQTIRVRAFVDDLIKASVADTKDAQEALRKGREQLQIRLQSDWGPNSAKRAAVDHELNAICGSVNSRAQQIFLTTGTIYKNYDSKIEAITSLDEFEVLGKTMPVEIVNEVSSRWQRIARDAQDKVMAQLNMVQGEMEDIMVSDASFQKEDIGVKKLSGADKFNCYRTSYMNGVITSGIGMSIIATLGLVALPIIGPIAFVGALLWGFFGGKESAQKKALADNKVMFKQELGKLLNELSAQLMHVQKGNRSVVGEFVFELNNSAREAVKNLFEQQKAQLQEEAKKLEEQAKKTAEEKKQNLEQLNVLRATWNAIATEVVKAGDVYKELQKVFNK